MISKKVEKQLVHLWGKVGFIVNLSQMIEYNLANILSADEILREFEHRDSMTVLEFNDLAKESNNWLVKLEKSTMGSVIKRAKEVRYFSDESINILEDVLKRRNYIAHKLFVDDLKDKHLETNPKHYYKYLEETIDLMHTINNTLLAINKKQREEYKTIY